MRGPAFLSAAALVAASGATAQTRADDVVVMRRTVARPTGQAPSQLPVDWKEGAWGAWSDSCSPTATRTRTVECLRSDGAARPAAECTRTKPTAQETELRTEGCTFSWAVGAWSPYGSTCAKTTSRNRTVACNALHAGQPATTFQIADTYCPAPTPTSAESTEVTSGCTWDWQTTSTGSWSSTCSATNTRPVTAVCRRSDGEIVADAQCASKGPKPTTESAPSCDIVNGGFEKGTGENWYRNGNPFEIVTTPVHSGRYAAALGTTNTNTISTPVKWPTSNNGFRLSFWFFIPETNAPLPEHCSGEIRSNFIGGVDYKEAPKGVWVQRSTLNSYKGYPRQASEGTLEIVAYASCNDGKTRPIYIDDAMIEIFN